jgi:hypothetical protein
MGVTTARILQSHGLNANISALQARELGVTDDTEQPVIGTTLGGPKYIPTAGFVTINTAAPAALQLMRRDLVTIACDTVAAGASITLDIRAGAQVAGYRCMVFCAGPDDRQVICTYATGAVEYIPGGMAQEFVWTGTAWNKTRMSWADRYVLGDQLALPFVTAASCKAPLIDRSVVQYLDEANWPLYVQALRAVKSAIGSQVDFTGTASAGTGSFTVTLDNTTPCNQMLTAIQSEAVTSAYQAGGEIANFLGGTLYGTLASGQLATINGVDYQITANNLATRVLTLAGNSPGAGAVTVNFYPYRYLGSNTKAILPAIGGLYTVAIGDAAREKVNGKRAMDRGLGHFHIPLSPITTTFSGLTSGTGAAFTAGAFNHGEVATTGSPTSDGTNGTPRTGKNTEPRNNPLNIYDWGGVYKP